MSWRTVVISNRCKLDLKMGYLVVRGIETKRVFLDEIALAELDREKVFCLLNLHCYFSIEELNAFFYDVALHKRRLLIFEGMDYPKADKEKKVVIDKDLCEIIL